MIVEQAVPIDHRDFRVLYGTPTAIREPMTIDSKYSGAIGAVAAFIFLASTATVSVQRGFELVSMCALLNRTQYFLGLCVILW